MPNAKTITSPIPLSLLQCIWAEEVIATCRVLNPDKSGQTPGNPDTRDCTPHSRPSYAYEVPSSTIRSYYRLSQYSAMSMPRMNSTLGWDLAYRIRRSRDDSRLGRPLTWGWRVMVMHVPYL